MHAVFLQIMLKLCVNYACRLAGYLLHYTDIDYKQQNWQKNSEEFVKSLSVEL